MTSIPMARDVCAFQANKPKASQAKSPRNQQSNRHKDEDRNQIKDRNKNKNTFEIYITTSRVVSVSNTRSTLYFYPLPGGDDPS